MSASPGDPPERADRRALWLLLAFGLGLRVAIALIIPNSGFRGDIASFEAWAQNLAKEGMWGFYERPFLHDYTPGFMYVLWFLGELRPLIVGQNLLGDLLKVPAILADLAIAWLVHSMLLELGARPRRALMGAALVLFLPIFWFDSVVWGQVDAVGVVFLLLGLRALWRDQPEAAAFWSVVAAIIKPQLGILVPIVAAVTLFRYLAHRSPDDDAPEPAEPPADAAFGGLRRWLARERGPIRVVTTAATGLLTAAVLAAPFKLSVIDLIRQVGVAAGGYPYLTVNAYNLWALVPHEGSSMATNWGFQCDAVASAGGCADPANAVLIGPLWAVWVGMAVLLAAVAGISLWAARSPSRLTLLVALAALALAFFVLPTRVHERYLFPFFALSAILAAISARWAIAYAVAAVAAFLNMYVVLTTVYPGNPSISDWLGIGPEIREPANVMVIAVAHTAVFAFAVWQLRARPRARLAGELAVASAPAVASSQTPEAGPFSPATIGHAGRPEPMSLGLRLAAIVPPSLAGAGRRLLRRLHGRPVRPDRSAALQHERGGRIERVDLLLLGVVVVGALVIRTARIDQPLTMMFDEVYHARTAAEFLQHWRYGEPHAIYEYTHPHLAKYAMAAGVVAFAGDRVDATSELGIGVRAASIEPRHDDPSLPGARAGDRLYVATGDAVVAYDLADRGRIVEMAWPGATALAVDHAGHRLYVASGDGRIGVLDTSVWLDPLRAGDDPSAVPPPEPLTDIGGPIQALHVTPDGSSVVVATMDGQVVTVDPAQGSETGRVVLEGPAAFADAGDTDAIRATMDEVVDPATLAEALADATGGDPADYARRLEAGAAAAADTVILGTVDADTKKVVEEEIAADGLAGISLATTPRIAVAGTTGLTFLAPATGEDLGHLPTDHPATGVALVTGIDSGKDLYVATGPELTRISIDPGQDPTVAGTIWLPGAARDIRYDVATEYVHVLGATPDGEGTTVYTIEPHGNAVFSDIDLPFDPAAWVLDEAQAYPAGDRQQLLAMSADGTIASAPIGGYGTGWRMPGVIAGAIMAGLLFLLARVLFRRRAVAVATAAFALAEGMLFAQARIAMNDVYVGLFIVAAYLVLAWLLIDPDRRGRAFWIALPTVGLLLGLGLAAKWVAAYAIAGAVVLVLGRSALGRFLVIGGLIGATVVLGTLAVSVPSGPTSGPNWTFFLIMVALTLLAVIVTVARPIAWSIDEVRFAVGAPVALGAAVFGVGVLAGQGSLVVGPAIALVALGAIAYVAFLVGRSFGVGPLAAPPPPGDPVALLPPASPPPAGWLRLGAMGGVPAVWGALSLLVIPLLVYVASYLPWVALGNRLTEGWPAGGAGRTLADLTASMYDYHDTLRAAHAAYSPWWAWPFDLKPVWFYSGSFAGSTSAATYDTGSLVVFWLGVAAMAFVAWQAWARRSPALAIVVLAFAWQWLPWARIDRGSFQYHYYTALPFVVLALGYLAAELWNGPSRRTWLGVRLAAGLAIVAPAVMWFFRTELCAAVGVERARPGSEACAADPGSLSTVVGVIGEGWAGLLRVLPPESLALIFLVPLVAVAWFVVTARDSRRFAAGMVVAAFAWVVIWYPNIAALPLPTRYFNAYQGVLPTWVWAFQFPVALDPAVEGPALAGIETLVLAAALLGTCLLVGYAAWSWRLAAAARSAGDLGSPGREGDPATGPT